VQLRKRAKKGKPAIPIAIPTIFIEEKASWFLRFPKKKPAKLTSLYYFKKTWEDESKKMGQIDIEISKAP